MRRSDPGRGGTRRPRRAGSRDRTGLISAIGPVAVGVVLAFAWNMTVSQPRGATGSDSGVTPEVGLTVEQAAAQAWASATPRTGTAGSPGTAGSGTWWARHPRGADRLVP